MARRNVIAEFRYKAHEIYRRKVSPSGSGGIIYLLKEHIGKEVAVIILE